jgi:hypothetical protein
MSERPASARESIHSISDAGRRIVTDGSRPVAGLPVLPVLSFGLTDFPMRAMYRIRRARPTSFSLRKIFRHTSGGDVRSDISLIAFARPEGPGKFSSLLLDSLALIADSNIRKLFLCPAPAHADSSPMCAPYAY